MNYKPKNAVETKIARLCQVFGREIITISFNQRPEWADENVHWTTSAYHSDRDEDVIGIGRTLEEALDDLITELEAP